MPGEATWLGARPPSDVSTEGLKADDEYTHKTVSRTHENTLEVTYFSQYRGAQGGWSRWTRVTQEAAGLGGPESLKRRLV